MMNYFGLIWPARRIGSLHRDSSRRRLISVRKSFPIKSNQATSSDTAAALEEILHDAGLVTGGPKIAVEQGILPLASMTSDEFRLVIGGSITGCTLALVREDRVQPFIDVYGGSWEESSVAGWFEIKDCNIRELDELPEAMQDATTLLHTTDTPSGRGSSEACGRRQVRSIS